MNTTLPHPLDVEALRRVVIGTAGHVDHGKTQLLQSLTGIDCDRWQEEKARGITLDLSFAYLFEGDLQISFIDVPGHKNFLDNALAGMGGIRVALLVVAATEGVMPQTREHLVICSLLGIPSVVVALTKVDLAEPDLVELASLDVVELLVKTPFAGATVVPVSNTTGQGLTELKRVLFSAARKHQVQADHEAPTRLPIDRAFHLHGLGVVVTGTLTSGSIQAGDILDLLPSEGQVRVRDTHVHGQRRSRVVAGERVSLRLVGVDLAGHHRGMQLVTPGAFELSTSLCVWLDVLPEAPTPIEALMEVRCYLLASETMARVRPLGAEVIRPGESGSVELRLDSPTVAIRGDCIILRRPTPAATIGGDTVLDPLWHRRRKQLGTDLACLMEGDGSAYIVWIEREGFRGLSTADLARRTGKVPMAVDVELRTQTEASKIIETSAAQPKENRSWISTTSLERLRELSKKVLERHFTRDRLSRGIPKAEFARRLLPGVSDAIAHDLLYHLEEIGKIQVTAGIVAPPGWVMELTAGESALIASLRRLYEETGFKPPTLKQASGEIDGTQKDFNSAIRFLVDGRELVRLPNQELISAAAFSRMRQEILNASWERFSVPQFKNHFGLTRKWAIPILMHCDSQGPTKRVGGERMVVRQK